MEPKVIVYIEGGVMHAVFSTDPKTKVIVWDEDNIQAGDRPPFPRKQLDELMEKATENCTHEVKPRKLFRVY